MLGVLSTRPVPASKYLREAECSLYRQAVLGQQGDGWGIGYYIDEELKVFKSEKSIYEDKSTFDALMDDLKSNLFIAHVRKASNPRGLPREALISKANSQPFFHSNFLFAHNGTLFIPDQVFDVLGEYKSLVRGMNDSEVLFAYLLQNLSSFNEPEIALSKLEKSLWDIHERIQHRRNPPYSSLNMIFSDGQRLCAFDKYLTSSDIKSFCRETPYFEMYYHTRSDEILVSSEMIFSGDWKPLPNGTMLKATIIDGEISLEIREIVP